MCSSRRTAGALISYVIPTPARIDFSSPRGVLVSGQLRRIVEMQDWVKVICLGDVVSAYCMESARLPDVIVFDGKTQRAESKFVKEDLLRGMGFGLVEVSNPPGGLSVEAMETLCDAINSYNGRIAIKVNGEEDMLTLAALSCAPANSLIIYGIPNRGAAVVVTNTIISHEVQTRLLRLVPSSIMVQA